MTALRAKRRRRTSRNPVSALEDSEAWTRVEQGEGHESAGEWRARFPFWRDPVADALLQAAADRGGLWTVALILPEVGQVLGRGGRVLAERTLESRVRSALEVLVARGYLERTDYLADRIGLQASRGGRRPLRRAGVYRTTPVGVEAALAARVLARPGVTDEAALDDVLAREIEQHTGASSDEQLPDWVTEGVARPRASHRRGGVAVKRKTKRALAARRARTSAKGKAKHRAKARRQQRRTEARARRRAATKSARKPAKARAVRGRPKVRAHAPVRKYCRKCQRTHTAHEHDAHGHGARARVHGGIGRTRRKADCKNPGSAGRYRVGQGVGKKVTAIEHAFGAARRRGDRAAVRELGHRALDLARLFVRQGRRLVVDEREGGRDPRRAPAIQTLVGLTRRLERVARKASIPIANPQTLLAIILPAANPSPAARKQAPKARKTKRRTSSTKKARPPARKAAKPTPAKKRAKRVDALFRFLGRHAVGQHWTWSGLPERVREDARVLRAARVIARRYGLELEQLCGEVVATKRKTSGALAGYGDQVASEYRVSVPGALHFGRVMRHEAGDQGAGRKRTRPPAAAWDPTFKDEVVACRRGTRRGFSDRGLTG